MTIIKEKQLFVAIWLLVFIVEWERNPWIHITVCELLVLDRNALCQITVGKNS